MNESVSQLNNQSINMQFTLVWFPWEAFRKECVFSWKEKAKWWILFWIPEDVD